MSFDWIDYIKLAEELIRENKEAYLRSGISRAYYGVFCKSRNIAGYKNWNQPDIHRKVIEHYKNSTNRNEKLIGINLDQLRKNRNEADYDEEKVIDYQLAQRILIKSKDILKRLGIQK